MTVWRAPVRGLVIDVGVQLDFLVSLPGQSPAFSIGDGLAIQYANDRRKFGIVRSVGDGAVVIEVDGKRRRIRPATGRDRIVKPSSDYVAWIVVAAEP
jgi:hypothetical protein